VTFDEQRASSSDANGVSIASTQRLSFAGARTGDGVSGTLTYGVLTTGVGPAHQWTETASVSTQITAQ
jgi:hypothetical protein